MTFQTYELSGAAGEPVLLLDFSIGTKHWRYTTADRPITYSANVYQPVALHVGNVIVGAEMRQRTLLVTVPRDTDIVERFRAYPPSGDVSLTIFGIHYTDPDVQAIVGWIGRVMGQNQKGSSIEIACEPLITGTLTQGLRRRWQLNCPHVLYKGGCNLNPASFAASGALTAVSDTVITSPAFTLGTGLAWPGGYVEWDSGDGFTERRSIDSASGTALTLNYGSSQLAVGLAVTAYPGCDHTMTNCQAFGNILNFGGAPYTPAKNPMDGNPVY